MERIIFNDLTNREPLASLSQVFNGPVGGNTSVSKSRHYATKCQRPPGYDTHDLLPTQLFAQVNETLQSSREKRNGIKPLVTSVHTRQTNAHKKMNTVLSESIEEAQTQQVHYYD